MEVMQVQTGAAGSAAKKVLITIGVLVAVAIVIGTAEALSSKHKSVSTAAGSDTSSQTTAAPVSQNYKDGSYSASGSYDSPGGEESIKINVTLQANVITATSAVSGSNSFQSRQYQEEFIGGYKPLVIGKNINTVHLSRVSGSSLTSQGFNEALDAIKNQAAI
jgi:uncharacterized protein with FMN-binding domain